MKFGEAITLLNAGHPVTRQGWNGKGMFLVKAGGYSVAAEEARPNGIITKEFLQGRGLTHLEILPHIDMWTAQNTYLAGWLASQSDMLADDWMVYVEVPVERPNTFTISAQQVEAMKKSGVWDDPLKRMKFINEYRNAELRKTLDEGHEHAWKIITNKKPHWTQTPEGKKKIAARKKRGWKK